MWFHGVGALPLRPDSRSDGKSGGLRPRPDTQLARLAEPVPTVPEMLTGDHATTQHNNQTANTFLAAVDGTDVLVTRHKSASVKSNGAAFHASDSNCFVKPLIGVHKTRNYPIPVKPPVVPYFIPKPPERRGSETSLPGSKVVTTPVISASKPDTSGTVKFEYTQFSKDKVFTTSAESKLKSAEESVANCAEKGTKQVATGSKTGTEKPKTRDGQVRSLASPSPRSSQLSLYLASINDQESRRTPSPAPPVPPLPTIKTSLQNLFPPEERENRRSPSPFQQIPTLQLSEYTLSIQKSPLKETTGKKSPLSSHVSTGKRSPLPDYISTGRKSPLIECIVKNIVRKSSSRSSIPEVHEPNPASSKPVKKECQCGDIRRPPTPARPKSVAFVIDDEENHVPPPPPPPRSVTNLSTTPTISKTTSCPGIIYSPRKDILIVKQPLAIIKPSVSPVQAIGIKSTSGKIVIAGGGDIEAEVVNVVTAGGEVLSVVCEKQGGSVETCSACVKTGSGNFCVTDGNIGKTGQRSDLNSSSSTVVGLSSRRSSVTSLSGSSLTSVVVGGCCGGSEFGGLIIGDDIIVMGASGGAGAGAKGVSGASEAESCGGGACRKILSGRHHHHHHHQHQQHTPSAGQIVKPQPQVGGGTGPGPGGGGTQVREECRLQKEWKTVGLLQHSKWSQNAHSCGRIGNSSPVAAPQDTPVLSTAALCRRSTVL